MRRIFEKVHVTSMQTIRQLGIALCLCGGIVLTSCDDKKRQANFIEFIREHDPVLKSKRDDIVTMIAEIKEKRSRLQSAKSQYRSDAARAEVDEVIQQVDAEMEHMQAKLDAIDSKIELAMVARDVRNADAGGLRSTESRELSENADAVLKQAKDLRNLLEGEGEAPRKHEPQAPVSKPESAMPKSKPSNTAGEYPIQADPFASPVVDQEAIQKEIRRLDASVANNEANLNQAWARIKQITRNGTVAIVKGSRQHVEYLQTHRVLEDCQAQLPDLRNRRELLKKQIEKP